MKRAYAAPAFEKLGLVRVRMALTNCAHGPMGPGVSAYAATHALTPVPCSTGYGDGDGEVSAVAGPVARP